MPAKSSTAALVLALAASTATATDIGGMVVGTLGAAQSPIHVTADVVVPSGRSLTVLPGATLLFAPGTALRVEGTLRAGGGGSATLLAPEPSSFGIGQWIGVEVETGGQVVLENATIRRAATGLRIGDGASADLRAVHVLESEGDGLVFEPGSLGAVSWSSFDGNGGAGIRVTEASPTIAESAFRSNRVPIALQGNAFPHLAFLSASRHVDSDGVVVDTSLPLTQPGTWWGAGIPYVLESASRLEIAPSSLLILARGTVVKLGKSATVAVAGQLVATGTAGDPCILTSINDDATLGDTNRNGATAPASGDWSGIDVYPGGSARLAHVVVRHGDDGLRVLTAGTATLLGCEVGPTLFRGLACSPGSSAYLETTAFHDSDVALEVAEASSVVASPTPADPSAGGNIFTCNGRFDAVNASEDPLALDGNYWGGTPDGSRFSGLVSLGTWLDVSRETPAERTLRVARLGDSDLVFTWADTGSCVGHRVLVSDRPNGLFAPLCSPLLDDWLVEAGGVYRQGPVHFYRLAKTY